MEHKTLVDTLARNLKRSKKDVGNLLGAFIGVVEERCTSLDAIAVPGFGTFEGTKRNEAVVTDSATGKRRLEPPRVEVAFTMSNVLKNKIK